MHGFRWFLSTPRLSIQVHCSKRPPIAHHPHLFQDCKFWLCHYYTWAEKREGKLGFASLKMLTAPNFSLVSLFLKTHTHTGNQSVCRMNSQAIATAMPWDLSRSWLARHETLSRKETASLPFPYTTLPRKQTLVFCSYLVFS